MGNVIVTWGIIHRQRHSMCAKASSHHSAFHFHNVMYTYPYALPLQSLFPTANLLNVSPYNGGLSGRSIAKER